MKYLVVAGPGYGKTSLVKGLNRLSDSLIAVDLDCKGLKPPYANEGIMTRFACDVFDSGYSVVTVHPSACDVDTVIHHCSSKGYDVKVVFAVEFSAWWLRYTLSRIGRRDGFDGNFFKHMLGCYCDIMTGLRAEAYRAYQKWGANIVTTIEMKGEVLSDFFGWSQQTQAVCFGVPERRLAFSHASACAYFHGDEITVDQILTMNWLFASIVVDCRKIGYPDLVRLCCRSSSFCDSMRQTEAVAICVVDRFSERSVPLGCEVSEIAIPDSDLRLAIHWTIRGSVSEGSHVSATLYIPDEWCQRLNSDPTFTITDLV